MSLLRRIAVIVSLVALCAAPALARRVTTPPPDENVGRTQPHSPAAEVTAPRVNHPAPPLPDDPPTCVTPPTRSTSGARAELSRTAAPEAPRAPLAPEPAADRRDKAKPAATVAPHPARTLRTQTQRNRVNTRPMPATPGMGTLLRIGMTVGREISYLDLWVPSRTTRTHTGRAPPATSTTPNSALASPVAPQHFAESFLPGSATQLPNASVSSSGPSHARDICAHESLCLPDSAYSPGGLLA